jgi:hypothetical protein
MQNPWRSIYDLIRYLYRKTTELFRDLFGLTFIAAAAVGFDRKAEICGAPLHEDVREKLRLSEVVHADETAWRNDGVGHYAWFSGNEKLAYFHIDRHRSAEVATSIFGERFEGILVRDRYAAYNGIGSQWQSCLAHINQSQEIKREHGLYPEQKNADENGSAISGRLLRSSLRHGRTKTAGILAISSGIDSSWSIGSRYRKAAGVQTRRDSKGLLGPGKGIFHVPASPGAAHKQPQSSYQASGDFRKFFEPGRKQPKNTAFCRAW